MKKILIIMALLLLAGCSSIKTKEEYKNGVTLSSMDEIPSVTELVELKEGVEAALSLDGNRILVTTVEDKAKEIEIPITFETMDIDGTQDVDLSNFYSNPDKLSTASYSINEDRTIMTITDSEKSFEVPVNVIFPKYTIAGDIVIDTYLGYDVHDFVSCDTDGVEITSVLKEEDSQIIISLKKGIWDISEIKDVTLIDSNPYPITYLSSILYNGLTFDYDGVYFIFVSDTQAYNYSEGDEIDSVEVYDDHLVRHYKGEFGEPLLDDISYYFEDDKMYAYVDQLNRGAQRNVKGSYALYYRVDSNLAYELGLME